MIDEKLFFNLKEQVQGIEDSYITLEDINNKFITPDNLDNYLTKELAKDTYLTIQESEDKINELIQLLNTKMDNTDLSIFVTNDFLSEYTDVLLDSINSKISNIDVYTKSEIDERLDNINYPPLTNYLTIDDLTSYGYVSEKYLNDILNSKNYLTEHQSLDNYVEKNNFESLIDTKLSKEFNNLKSFYDKKIEDIRKIYMSKIEENGYITFDEVIDTISSALIDYFRLEDLETLLDSKDYANKSYLHDYVERYVANKFSEKKYLTYEDIKDFITISDIPVKLSDLFNDMGYLTEHQSLVDYVKKVELNDYVTQDDLKHVLTTINTNNYTDFLKHSDLINYAKLSDIPVKLSDLFNDMGYLTEHQSLVDYVKKVELNDYVTDSEIENKLTEIIKLIPNINLTDYAKLSDIPVKLSELIIDIPFLTEHQSLVDYVKKVELNDYISQIEFREFVQAKGLNNMSNFVYQNDIQKFAKLSDIPVKLSELIIDIPFLTEHQSLKGYVKKTDLGEYVLHSELDKILKSLNSTGQYDGVTFDDLNEYVKLTDIPKSLSELYNDMGYLTEHQSLKGYVKKVDLNDYATQDDLKHVSSLIDSINFNLFLKHDDLNDYVTQDEAKSLYLLKTDKPNLTEYVKKTDMSNYVKKSNLPNFNEFVKLSDLPNNENYLTKSDISEYAKLTDIPDVSYFVNINDLELYTKYSDFEKYKKNIDSKQYQTKSDISNTLDNYVKKSDIGTASNVDLETIKEMISEKIESIHIPVKVSELINDKEYTSFKENLSGYVKRSEIASFVTMDDINNKFLKINDFILPSNIVYIENLEDYVSKADFIKLTMDAVYKSQLSDYVLQSDFDKSIHKFEKSVENKLTNFEKSISNLIGDSENIILPDFNDFVRKSVLEDFSEFEEYLDTKFISKELTKNYIQILDEKINNQRIWINDNFIKKSEQTGNNISSSLEDTNYDALFNDYYTKVETHLKFLSKEDYRGIKTAATINFEYNDYPDLFFEVLNNNENIKINDGFYVVEEKAYIIRNNQIVPVCDRKSPHWEIETTDEDWRNQKLENSKE